jgi:hypothetical protein
MALTIVKSKEPSIALFPFQQGSGGARFAGGQDQTLPEKPKAEGCMAAIMRERYRSQREKMQYY